MSSLRSLAFLSLLSSLSLAVACGGDDGGSGDGDAGADGGSDGDFDDDGIPDDEDPDDDNDGNPDSADECPRDPDPCNQVAEACQHLDIVIAVDPSGSMDTEKAALAPQVFGGPQGFATSLVDVSGGIEDYRVGTIDACPNPAIMHTEGAGGACSFSSAERWIVGTPDSDPTAVTAEFECVGDIWEGDIACDRDNDDDEQPALSALAALTPPYIDAENAGFLRDDALLVVIAITDEDEEMLGTGGGPNTVQGLYDGLTALKGGVNNMVFLGIGATSECPGGDPFNSNVPAVKLKELTDKYIAANRGVWWNLCDGNFGQGLDEALEVIETACNEFDPVD